MLYKYRHRNDVIYLPVQRDFIIRSSWWRHQMGAFSALLALCAGNSPVTDEFPSKRPVKRSFDVFFDLHLNQRLSKQSWGWWFETPSRSFWRHCNVWILNSISTTGSNIKTCSSGQLFPRCLKGLICCWSLSSRIPHSISRYTFWFKIYYRFAKLKFCGACRDMFTPIMWWIFVGMTLAWSPFSGLHECSLYNRLSIYRCYIFYNNAHSTTVTMMKFLSDLHSRTTPHTSPLRGLYEEKWPRCIESAL